MTKEEYLKKKEQIQAKREELLDMEREIENEYLNSFKGFPIGSKILITTPELNNGYTTFPMRKRYGIIKGYTIGVRGQIKPIVKKCKKDGSESMVKDYIWYDETIELVENE